MPVALAIGAAGILGAGASVYAANTQAGAEKDALNAQNHARAQLNPWINVGQGANNQLGALYGIGADGTSVPQNANYNSFTQSPDYQFALQQGNLGLQRYENANGMALSGGALKDVAQFNQGLATQQFGNYYNRLLSLSQLGQSAASAGVGGANSAAQTMGAIGQSQASGVVGASNSLTGSLNNALLYNAINRSGYAYGGGTPSLGLGSTTFGMGLY